jgi:two-component system NtrC family sensor kinase
MSPTLDGALDQLQLTIADLQRQLATSNAERDEALEQQTAIAEVLEVINSSPGDLPPVFDAILEKAMRLCQADGGYFLSYQDGSHVLAAGRGLRPELAAILSRQDQPEPGSPAALVAEGAPYIHVIDLKDNDLYRSGTPRRRAIVGTVPVRGRPSRGDCAA